MSRPVTGGEEKVLSRPLGCKDRAEMSPVRGWGHEGDHTLVKDQGRGIDDDPCVQHLWEEGGQRCIPLAPWGWGQSMTALGKQ